MAKDFPVSDARKPAFEALNIPIDNRVILCLDGGGMRGILTIQLLKKIEEIAGIPCHKLFDMVAGTSTGGIIASLIATGHDAAAIETLYDEMINEVFTKRTLGNRFLNPPQYTKENFRQLVKKTLNNISIEDACKKTDTDILITAKDMTAGEETFFTCFKKNESNYTGTYRGILLRAAVEATMSAPTYFQPLERFVDGGTTTFNNPSMAAMIEALVYSHTGKYERGKLTVFSLGTGASAQFIPIEEAQHPDGLDIKFWLNWLMTELGQDASDMQTDVLRSEVIRKDVDYRRFQISLDSTALSKLPNCPIEKDKHGGDWLRELSDEYLRKIDMADTTKYDLMKVIGRQFVEYIITSGNCFKKDLINEKGWRDQLVTTSGDVERIKQQMSDPDWLDSFAR